jgi:hypothetical protein
MFHHRIVKRVAKADEGTQSYEYAIHTIQITECKNLICNAMVINSWHNDIDGCFKELENMKAECIKNINRIPTQYNVEELIDSTNEIEEVK